METGRTRRTGRPTRGGPTPERSRLGAAPSEGAAEAQAEDSGYIPVVGDRVLVGPTKVSGFVAFVGNTEFSPGEWIGVVLEEAVGKNDGTVKGIKYFDCKPNYGLFVRAKQVERAPPPTARANMRSSKVRASEQLKASEMPKDEVQKPHLLEQPHASQQPKVPQEPMLAEQRKPPPPVAKAGGTKVPEVPKVPDTPKILEPSAIIASPKATEALNPGTSSLSASSELMEQRRAKAQLDLADAVEEHDDMRIREMLPLAYSCGVAPAFIESAHRVLNFRLQRSLLRDIDEVREAVASLGDSVQEIQERTQELGLSLPQQAVQPSTAANTDVAAAESRAGLEVGRDATDALLRTLGQQFEQQLLPALEQRMAEIIQQVVAEVTKELREATVDMQLVRAGHGSGPSCPRVEEEDDVEQALQGTTLAEQEAAAIKIQALSRGRCERKKKQKRHDAAVCIQRRLRARGTAGVHQRCVRLHAEQRHSAWLEVFLAAADCPGPTLGQKAFCETLQQVHQHLSQGQAQVLWAGHLRNTGHCFIDLEGFIGVAEAVEHGSAEAADWADVSPEVFALLGAERADAAATKLQAVYRGQRVRAGLAEACPFADGCARAPFCPASAPAPAGRRASAPAARLADPPGPAPDGDRPAPSAGAAEGRRASAPACGVAAALVAAAERRAPASARAAALAPLARVP